MKVEDTSINKEFYEYDEGECFATEYGSYYMKIKDVVSTPDDRAVVVYKAVNLENGCVIEMKEGQQFRSVNAKVVIE